MPNKDQRVYSAGDVARMLDIAPQGVWYHTRRLGVGKQVGGRWLYSDKDVMAIRLHTRGKSSE